MKKAKILFPALGVLILSSAAAVTGTVAWFTANLQASAETTNVTVVKTGSSLGASLTAGDGTELIEKNTKVKHKQLIDGSVDLTTGDIYGPNFGTDGSTITGFTAGAAEVGTGQFRASKFTVTLTMDLEKDQAGTSYGIYVDRPNFVINTTGDGAAEKAAEKALRIGIKSPNKYLVWAPYDETATELNYVGGSTTGIGNYAQYTDVSTEIIHDAEADATVTGEAATASHKLWLGTLTRPSASSFAVSLKVDVYTWFEGAVIDNNFDVSGVANYTVAFNAAKLAA